MVQAIDAAVEGGSDFAVETTLAGRSYVGHIREWRSNGYRVALVFLRLPNVELAIERVAFRVSQGGHDIPRDVIHRRFHQGWQNFEHVYRPLVDSWQLYDASHLPARLIATGKRT